MPTPLNCVRHRPHPARPIRCETAVRLLCAAIAVGLAAPLAAAPLDCMIQPHQVVQLGSPGVGVIESISVDRGDLVTRGQPLARLNAGVERAALAVARERARQQGEVIVADSARTLADREYQRATELHAQNFVSGTYLDKSKAEAEMAEGRAGLAEERRKLATRELELAAAQLEQRTIRSPIDGVVVERYLSPGEYIDQKPMLRIAAIDPLRVDVLVPAAAFGRIAPGMKGIVTPELLERGLQEAVVKMVDRVIDAASNTFRVRLELPNPKAAIPAGLRCKVDLGVELPLPAQATKSTSAAVSLQAPVAPAVPKGPGSATAAGVTAGTAAASSGSIANSALAR